MAKTPTREDKLEDSILGTNVEYKHYSVGRTRSLKKLGNPMFGGEPENKDEWDFERRCGTAWVFFTRDMDWIRDVMSKPNRLSIIDSIWEEEMHYLERDRIFNWILEEADMVNAAQTEAIQETRGKPQEEEGATNHTG